MSSPELRFEFGANWRRFLKTLTEERIREAEQSLCQMLGVTDLTGRSFLDVGSGSGLFSLAARRLGAVVHSFDYDEESVACTAVLRERFYPNDDRWRVERGSVLDRQYVEQLGRFDVVYSWGVLHHTGALWTALSNVLPVVAPGGLLFIAIYNYQPWLSGYWSVVKRTYNWSPRFVRRLMHWTYFGFFVVALAIADALRGRSPLRRYSGRGRRGMRIYYDVADWIGGWPFEPAQPEAVFKFVRAFELQLEVLKTCGGRHGCNEFVFSRPS